MSDPTSNSNILREITNQDTTDFRNNLSRNSRLNAAALVDSHLNTENSKKFALSASSSSSSDPNSLKKQTNFFSSIKTLSTSNSTVTPVDCQFAAENTSIKIIPRFSSNNKELELICGNIGPFKASQTIVVPVWVALMLKRQRKCVIVKPDWMDNEKIDQIRTNELSSGEFQPPPHPHYRELTESLLNEAADDIENADEIRTSVKDLWDARTAKLSACMKSFMHQEEKEDLMNNGEYVSTGRMKEKQEMFGNISNITQIELCLVRDPVLAAMDVKRVLLTQKNIITG